MKLSPFEHLQRSPNSFSTVGPHFSNMADTSSSHSSLTVSRKEFDLEPGDGSGARRYLGGGLTDGSTMRAAEEGSLRRQGITLYHVRMRRTIIAEEFHGNAHMLRSSLANLSPLTLTCCITVSRVISTHP